MRRFGPVACRSYLPLLRVAAKKLFFKVVGPQREGRGKGRTIFFEDRKKKSEKNSFFAASLRKHMVIYMNVLKGHKHTQ